MYCLTTFCRKAKNATSDENKIWCVESDEENGLWSVVSRTVGDPFLNVNYAVVSSNVNLYFSVLYDPFLSSFKIVHF